MLYLIGLGLNEKGISKEGLLVLERCKKVYLEGYTVNFPYNLEELHLGKKNLILLNRKDVESNMLLKEAKSIPIALLVYGSPFFATTHISLILDAKAQKVKTKVIYAASVFDAVIECGLHSYKFGKTASIPKWDCSKKFEPESFIEIIKENQSINAHTLLLIDIGLDFHKAIEQFEKASKDKKIKIGKIIVCSQVGTENSRFFYGDISELSKKYIAMPFCFIIPSKELHFTEKEALENL